MDQKIQPQHIVRAAILKAMGHPTRLFILEELNKQERCVNELTIMIGSDVSTVSKHLSVLKNAGLVFDTKRGNSIFYRLCCSGILEILNSVQNVIKTNIDRQMEIAQCCGLTKNKP